jgi:NAD(P)-dependent dehydrogenase (short-subunit alcohol dehydrogenase family)
MAGDFKGRKVVITSAAGVFGVQLSSAFADAGALLCLSGLRADALASLAEHLALEKSRLLTHITDLTNPARHSGRVPRGRNLRASPDTSGISCLDDGTEEHAFCSVLSGRCAALSPFRQNP